LNAQVEVTVAVKDWVVKPLLVVTDSTVFCCER